MRHLGSEAADVYDPVVHRLRWQFALVLFLALAGAVAGFAVAATQASRFESSLTFYVALTPEVGLDIANSGNFVEQRSRSYVALVETDEFESIVDERDDGNSSITLLADYRSGTALIDVTVVGPSASRVGIAADNLASQLPQSVGELDASQGDALAPLQLRPLGRPTSPEDTRSLIQPMAMGSAAGLLIGVALLVVANRRPSGRHVMPAEASPEDASAHIAPEAAASR